MSLLHWKRTRETAVQTEVVIPDDRPVILVTMLGQLDEGVICLLNNLVGLRHELTSGLVAGEVSALDTVLTSMPEVQQSIENACRLVSGVRSRGES
jgi:hypothetical protein